MCYIRIFELCDRLLLNNKIERKDASDVLHLFTKKICMSKGMYVRYILDLYRQL